jgi:hypothetical protein
MKSDLKCRLEGRVEGKTIDVSIVSAPYARTRISNQAPLCTNLRKSHLAPKREGDEMRSIGRMHALQFHCPVIKPQYHVAMFAALETPSIRTHNVHLRAAPCNTISHLSSPLHPQFHASIT